MYFILWRKQQELIEPAKANSDTKKHPDGQKQIGNYGREISLLVFQGHKKAQQAPPEIKISLLGEILISTTSSESIFEFASLLSFSFHVHVTFLLNLAGCMCHNCWNSIQ